MKSYCSQRQPPRRANWQPGFTLVEMVVVIIIIAVITIAAGNLAIPIIRQTRVMETQAKLDRIAKAIDFYATQNYRVPCPAQGKLITAGGEPFGFEQGSVDGSIIPNTCTAGPKQFGIVPFKTLGIPIDWARDSWGNYITYAASPAFSINPVWSQQTANDFPVHARCRTAEWYASPVTYDSLLLPGATSQYVNRNPAKARFCCPYPPAFLPGTDLIIKDGSGNSQLAYGRFNSTAASYALMNAGIPVSTNTSVANVPPIPSTDRPAAPVYALISHGANGYGAPDINSGGNIGTAGATNDETTNAGTSGTIYEIPKIDRSGPEQNFDDVVVWRTQDLIFAEQGKSCSVP